MSRQESNDDYDGGDPYLFNAIDKLVDKFDKLATPYPKDLPTWSIPPNIDKRGEVVGIKKNLEREKQLQEDINLMHKYFYSLPEPRSGWYRDSRYGSGRYWDTKRKIDLLKERIPKLIEMEKKILEVYKFEKDIVGGRRKKKTRKKRGGMRYQEMIQQIANNNINIQLQGDEINLQGDEINLLNKKFNDLHNRVLKTENLYSAGPTGGRRKKKTRRKKGGMKKRHDIGKEIFKYNPHNKEHPKNKFNIGDTVKMRTALSDDECLYFTYMFDDLKYDECKELNKYIWTITKVETDIYGDYRYNIKNNNKFELLARPEESLSKFIESKTISIGGKRRKKKTRRKSIRINPKMRGVFTKKSKRKGMSVQKYAKYIVKKYKGKKKTKRQLKLFRQALFAKTAKKWKKRRTRKKKTRKKR